LAEITISQCALLEIAASQREDVGEDRGGSKSTVAVAAYGSKTPKADQG